MCKGSGVERMEGLRGGHRGRDRTMVSATDILGPSTLEGASRALVSDKHQLYPGVQ